MAQAAAVDLPGIAGNYISTPDTPENSLAGATVLRLPGGLAGGVGWASTPDSAAVSITGDIDIRVKVWTDQWVDTDAVSGYPIIAKGPATVAGGGWWLRTQGTTGGAYLLFGFTDGTTTYTQSSNLSSIPAYGRTTPLWLRATRIVSTGVTALLWSEDGAAWTTIISSVVAAGIATIDNAHPVTLGAYATGNSPLPGDYYYAEVRNGVNGTVVAKFDPSTISPTVDQTPTTLVSSTGETWTMFGTRWNWRRDNEVRSLRLTGVSGVQASTPDSAALSITGDIDIRVKVAMDDWTPAGISSFIGKYTGGGGTRSWLFQITNTTGALRYYWSVDGTVTTFKDSTANLSALVAGQMKWVRVTHDIDNGATGNDVKFYTSDNGVTWVQLGATVTTAGVTSIFDGTATVNIGAYAGSGGDPLAGNVYYAEVRNGIDGTVVANPSFENQPWDVGDTGAATGTDTATAANTWTLNGAAVIKRAFNTDLDIRVKLSMDDWTPINNPGLVGKVSYALRVLTAGTLNFWWYDTAGIFRNSSSTVATGFVDSSVKWVRATFDVDNGAAGNDVKFYTSDDGITWAQLGSTVTTAGATNIEDGASALWLGSLPDIPAQELAGNVYYADIRRGIDGVVVAKFDPTEVAIIGIRNPSVVTMSGTTWTVNGSAWGWTEAHLLAGSSAGVSIASVPSSFSFIAEGGCYPNICSCTIADDGIRKIGGDYLVNTGEGRRNTVVSGSGRALDPYTVSFIDSESYRPDAAEFTYPSQTTSNNAFDLFDANNGAVIIYETPGVVIYNGPAVGSNFLVAGFFQYVGASATFVGNTTGTRKIVISEHRGILPGDITMLAGNSTDAPAENLTLSTSGFYPGNFIQGYNNPAGTAYFSVAVFQDSGSSLALSNIKFWVGGL